MPFSLTIHMLPIRMYPSFPQPSRLSMEIQYSLFNVQPGSQNYNYMVYRRSSSKLPEIYQGTVLVAFNIQYSIFAAYIYVL